MVKFNAVIFGVLFAVGVFHVSCTEKATPQKPLNTRSALADSLLRVTDSLSNRDYLHRNFYGIHKHGQSLAAHAHQDLRKRSEIIKKANSVRDIQKDAFYRQEERRKARVAKALGRDSVVTSPPPTE